MDISAPTRHVFSMEPERIIDARGLKCPLPVLRLGRVLRGLSSGACVTLLADDPMAVLDVPHFCAEAGHTLRSQTDAGSYQVYVVERA